MLNDYTDKINEKDKSILSMANYFKGEINPSVVWSSLCDFSLVGDSLSIKPDHCNIVYHIVGNNIYPAYKL